MRFLMSVCLIVIFFLVAVPIVKACDCGCGASEVCMCADCILPNLFVVADQPEKKAPQEPERLNVPKDAKQKEGRQFGPSEAWGRDEKGRFVKQPARFDFMTMGRTKFATNKGTGENWFWCAECDDWLPVERLGIAASTSACAIGSCGSAEVADCQSGIGRGRRHPVRNLLARLFHRRRGGCQ